MPKKEQDYKIPIDASQSRLIAEVICKEIEQSLGENKKVYDRANRAERQYSQVTKWMALGKSPTDPWYGAADYFIPLTEWIVDAVWGRVLKVLFYKRPWMTAKGAEASDVPKEQGVTDFVDQIHSEVVELHDNMKYFVKQCLKLPFAVLKYCWERQTDKIYEQAEAVTMASPDGVAQEQVLMDEKEKLLEMTAAGFVPQGEPQQVTVLRTRELSNSTKLRYVRFCDYVWCGSAKRGYKPYWEGDRFWLTMSEMKNDERFIPEVVEKLSRQAFGGEDMTASQQAIAQRSKLFECYNWYGRLPLNKDGNIDFIDTEAIEHEVHVVVSYKDKETLMVEKWPYKRIPKLDRVYIRGEFEEAEGFCGRSLADKLYMTQKELNTWHNTIMNNAQLAMMKIFTKRKTLQGPEWERPQIRPGVVLEVDMPGDVGVLDVGDVKAIAWEVEQSFINFAERISNVSVYQTGTARQGGGQKTKGEVERTVYEGNIGIDKFIDNMFKVMKKISQWTVDYYAQNMPVGLERRIRGENEEMIFPTEDNMQIFEEKGVNPMWEADDIAGKFDFKWENTSLNTSEAYQISVANDLQERYLPHPMVAGSLLATWDILRRGLIARKITDWQNILPPKEAIVAEMQRMEAEAQAKEQIDSGEKDIKGMAIQKAGEMGVPPVEAERLINQANAGGEQNAKV